MKKEGYSLQTVILLFTIPTLTIITGCYAWSVYLRVYETILDGFNRKLYAASTTTASFIDGDEHNKILTDFKTDVGGPETLKRPIDEKTTRYRGYAAPMKRILEKLGLSYHYTVIPKENNLITYVLDATEGEEHSAAGSEEDNPPEEAERLSRVMKTGKASLSDIQQFDIWGLLKIGTAPIVNKKGEVKALVGADVNISVMNKKTREALLLVFGAGAVSLLLAVFVSFIIARKLIEPIRLIKEASLRVAAGKFDTALLLQNPAELAELSRSFNQASETLRESAERLRHAYEEHETSTRREQLIRFFKNDDKSTISQCTVRIGRALAQIYGASGWLERRDTFLLWLADGEKDEAHNARLISDIKVLVGKIIEKHGWSEKVLMREFSCFFPDSLELLLLLDKNQGIVKTLVQGNPSPSSTRQAVRKNSFEFIELDAVFCNADSSFTLRHDRSPARGQQLIWTYAGNEQEPKQKSGQRFFHDESSITIARGSSV